MSNSIRSERPWTIEAVKKLQQLWAEGVSVEVISQALQRDESAIRAKAAELKLRQHVEAQ